MIELGSEEIPPPKRLYDARLMRRLLGYARPYWRLVGGAVALIILSSLLQLVGPLATAVAIDLFIRPVGGSEAEISVVSASVERFLEARGYDLTPGEGLALMGVVYLGALVTAFVVLYFQGFLMQIMGQYIMFDLRRELFDRLQRLPVAFFDRRSVGRLVTRVTNDVDALNELFTAGMVSIFGDVVLLLGIVAVLFWFNWRLALVTFAILPLLWVLTLWFKIRARQSYREVRHRLAAINSFLQEQITGMSIIQLFNRERWALESFREINDEHRKANIRAIFYYAVYYPAVELITALGTGLILWYGGIRVMAGALSLGALVAFLQYAQRFYQPLADLSEKYNIIVSPPNAFRPHRVRGEIEFEKVTFSYNAGEPVLKDISFRLAPGELVAIVGHTGSGKSTLANLILRFYDIEEGAIRIDGVDVRQWDLPTLRGAIGMVLQDVFLFSGNVADNIRLGSERIDETRMRWAASEVHALEFIEKLPGGFSGIVRERGAGLSVGQKQLLAFARALAFDPTVLILDEATSSIDTETEQLIQLGLERLLAERTSLVIAHRLSTVQRADRILVLHRGELREMGSHAELLAQRGVYYRLHQLQYQGELEPVECPPRASLGFSPDA
jgi:ATP-binding cassette subfamily B protein